MVDRGCLDWRKNPSFVVDERVLAQAPIDQDTPLPNNFFPGNYDVKCGRGKACFNHIGNRRFRITIEINLGRYAKANSKLEKSLIVMSIVDTIRESSPTGGFVKHDQRTGTWYEVGDHVAREKVGQALREALSHQRGQALKKGKSQSRQAMKSRRSSTRDSFILSDAMFAELDYLLDETMV